MHPNRPRSARRWTLPLIAAAGLLTACPQPPVTPDAGDAARDAPVASDAGDAATVDDLADVPPPPPPPPCPATAASTPPAFPGLSAPVEVLRDAQGIPHIFARTDADLFFASGYVQAIDRLFQMELMRRSASGTLAAVIGREKLEQDQLVRLMDIPRWGHESAERVRREHPDVYALIVAWVAGVNRRVNEVTTGAAPRPPGFRATEFDFAPARWTVDDAMSVSRLILFRNANQLEYDILATVIRDYVPAVAALPIFRSLTDTFVLAPGERPSAGMGGGAAFPPAGAFAGPLPDDTGERMARFRAAMAPFRSGGSNNWAVSGAHTFNGRPLIAGDPHQSLQSPGVFWAQHLNSAAGGGAFDVAGFSFVGTPGVQLGHNRRIVWTATTVYPDTMDIWQVRAPDNGARIELGGQSYPVERCTATIEVRGEPPVAELIERVPGHGVLLPRTISPLPLTRGSNRLLFDYVGFRPTVEAEVFFEFDRAASVDEFDTAVQRMELGAFHFVAADARGIGYRSHMLVPARGPTAMLAPPYAMLDGSDARTVWTGAMLGADQLPHSRGAARGFLSSANNDPFGFTSNGAINDDPFYFGVWYDPGTRARRIESELSRVVARGSVTLDDMKALQLDTHNLLADALLPALFDAFGRVETDPALAMYRGDARLAALVDALRAWDRAARRESSTAVVFEGFEHFLARGVLADDFGPTFDAVLEGEPVYMLKMAAQVVNRGFPGADAFMQQGRDVLLVGALAATRDWLVTRFGGTEPTRYRWDAYHRSAFNPMFREAGPFATTPVATDGTVGTVNVSQAVFFQGATPRMFHESRSGAAYRMVASFNADGTPVAEINFPRGNSGDPGSPYWANTQDDWVSGTYRPLLFERAAIEAAARERLTIAP